MTTNPIDNPPAFPCKFEYLEDIEGMPDKRVCKGKAPGMTLRDYFAAAALTGAIASGKTVQINGRDIAVDVFAYTMADALLAARVTKGERK